jgi:hypothetical protein
MYFHHTAGSPAIDAGVDPTSAVPERFRWYATRDLDFEVRPLDGNGSSTAEWDIGCDELAP